MASTYSPKLRLELIGAGEQAGLWGTTTNKNIGQLLEQAIAGVTTVELDGLSGNYTLTALDGAPDQSRSAVIKCVYSAVPAAGSINLIIPAQTKLYVVRNDCGQIIYVKTSGQTGGVEIKDGESTLVFCDGTDAVAGIETASVGTLTVSGGGTGSTTFTAGFVKSPGGTGALTSVSAVNLATETTGNLPVNRGGTGATDASTARTNLGLGTLSTLNSVSLTSNVTGTLPVANGGTGGTNFPAGRMLIGNGTGSFAVLGGTVTGQVATWDNSTGTWTASTAPGAGVSSFSGGTTGLTPSIATTGAVTLGGVLGISNGGTGQTGIPSNGQLLIGDGTSFTRSTLTAGSGITINNGAGSITISATTGGGGTVTSVGLSGGTTGLTVSGSPITTLGTMTLGGTLAIANGGTGSTTAAGARSQLGVSATGTDTTYLYRANNLSDLQSVPTARSNLGVTATGADTTYAFRANNLSDLTSPPAARSNLGLGSLATASSVSLTSQVSGVLPMANGGTGVSSMPAASAFLSSNVALGSFGSWLNIIWTAENYDTNSAYNTTNGRFTPQVAGYYLVTACIVVNCGFSYTGAKITSVLAVAKNGSTSASYQLGRSIAETGAFTAASGSAIIYLNGSTDYLVLQVFPTIQNTTLEGATNGTSSNFSVCFLRP